MKDLREWMLRKKVGKKYDGWYSFIYKIVLGHIVNLMKFGKLTRY